MKKIIKIIILCLTLFIVLLAVNIIFYIEHDVPLFVYKFELRKLKQIYGKDKFSHFPEQIPSDSKNYYFHVEHSWDNNLDLLHFDIDKNYIKEMEEKYKNKCKIYGKKSDIFAKYLFPHIEKVDNEDKLCIFNEPSYKDRYLTGYVISKERNRIYFFYENW